MELDKCDYADGDGAEYNPFPRHPVVMATQTYVTELTVSQPAQQQQPQQQYVHVIVSESGMQATASTSDSARSVPLQVSSAGQPPGAAQGVQQGQQQQQQRLVVQTSTPPQKSTQPQRVQVPQQVQVQHVYPSHVQYVDGSDPVYTNGAVDSKGDLLCLWASRRAASYPYSEAQLYGQGEGPVYYDSQLGTVVSSHGLMSTGGSGGGSEMGAMGVGGGQVLTEAGGAYLIQTMDGSGQSLSQATRASPATIELTFETLQSSEGFPNQQSSLLNHHVQWLIDNYETAEGVSLPRCTLYNHYLRHCQEQKLDPVNAASFGKLIRSVFLGLRTRRLGTRGNSKYHYYGIRIKASSPLNRMQDDHQHAALRQQPLIQKQRFKPTAKADGVGEAQGVGPHGSAEQALVAQTQQHQQFLDASRALPAFAEVEWGDITFPPGVSIEHVRTLQTLYREHCEAILDIVVNLQFGLIETIWQTFWRYSPPDDDDTSMDVQHRENGYEKRLPKGALATLCRWEPVMKWMRSCDYLLYQALVEVLIPDVLRPIPSALTQAIRNFAKSLEGWLATALSGLPQEVIHAKVAAVSAFAQTLRRYTSLNHLAQAARAVLQNTSQINQMLNDLNRVDFANVQEQASWVCQCEEGVVTRLEQDFKVTLQQQNSLEQWAVWLDEVVTTVLKPHEGSASYAKAARQFLLKWSFYSSMVIRDLTLRSAASFGSFHLIRLLYDEYMFYLVEQRVARARGETPIAVMGEFADLGSGFLSLNGIKDREASQRDSWDEVSVESGEPAPKLTRTELK
ncbi:transcription factor RFX3-like isoform X2 [Petromyzon marinus]|uniref:Transcription factor RFX3-like isoform X2 n=1 Tax=Petromyzon marinus TaxID=7757 RepID=A0AAJ7U1V4_PETMA|nr:transcription factor RFX3-like isoform X2 [Petromyzon marinus]